MKEQQPLVSIIIPSYNRKEALTTLLTSLHQSTYPKQKLEIIVVDDHSSQDYSPVQQQFPDVVFIRNKEEKLLAETRNIGIRHASGKYLFLIDDDNVVDEHCIEILVNYLDQHPNVGVVAPCMYYLPEKQRIWCLGVIRNDTSSLATFIGKGELDHGQYSMPLDVEEFPNAFMLRREVVETVGLFDHLHFPIHYDEADFCKRAREHGYKIHCVPEAKVWHDIEPPTTIGSKRDVLLTDERIAFYAARNRIFLQRKHATFSQLFLFFTVFLPFITSYYLYWILKSTPSKKGAIALAYLRGVWKGITAPPSTEARTVIPIQQKLEKYKKK